MSNNYFNRVSLMINSPTQTPSKLLSSMICHPHTSDMGQVDCLALCGGQGQRLFPLTQTRSKPHVAFGGYYRLVDIALSNALASKCRKVFVLTQYFSSGLHQHIYRTYSARSGHAESIEILTAEQRPGQQAWYEGTADAVRRNMPLLRESPAEYFLIICGDQVYHLDFAKMLAQAKKTNADLLIASVSVDQSSVNRLGILQVDADHAITDFCEKPQDPKVIERFACADGSFLGSMGIYLFKREALFRLLEADPRTDFGKHLIPTQMAKGNCYSYVYNGYWEDIGTVKSFYHTNISLTRQEPAFSWYMDHPILHALRHQLPPAKILQTAITHSLICDGCVVDADQITNSILGPRTIVQPGSVIQDCYILGNESYHGHTGQPLTVGRNCKLQGAILDHHVSVGNNVTLSNVNRLNEYDGDGIFIRDGIIIVSRGTHLPDGFTL